MLNPVWLKTFVTLIDTGHFTQAAEKLFMTQPGVSQHINKLEQACGHLLIKREKKSFVVTEQGRLVYNYSKYVAKNEHLLFEQLGFDDPLSGSCSLACSGSIALLLYPKLLTLQSQQPKLFVKLKAAPNQQILNDVKQGNIDQGIVTNIPNSTLFDVKELGNEELCLVVPQSADINTNQAQVLTDIGLISHPDAEHYLSLYFAQSDQPDLKGLNVNRIPVIGSINQIGQILHPIAKGLGFTVLPKSALDSYHDLNHIKILKPQKPVIERLYLIWQKNRKLPARYKAFNSIIEQVWL